MDLGDVQGYYKGECKFAITFWAARMIRFFKPQALIDLIPGHTRSRRFDAATFSDLLNVAQTIKSLGSVQKRPCKATHFKCTQ